MSDRESLLAKVQKLMALAESANEHEAALAAAKAQSLIEQYNIEQHELETSGRKAAEPIGLQRIDWPDRDNIDRWEKELVQTVARNMFCDVLWTPLHVMFIGRPTDVLVVEYTWAHLREKIVSLVRGRLREAKYRGEVSNPKKWRRDWLLGAVDGIREKMIAQHRQMQQDNPNSSALVVVRDAEIKTFISQTFSRVRIDNAPRIQLQAGAYHDGRQHGTQLDINPGLPDHANRKRLS